MEKVVGVIPPTTFLRFLGEYRKQSPWLHDEVQASHSLLSDYAKCRALSHAASENILLSSSVLANHSVS